MRGIFNDSIKRRMKLFCIKKFKFKYLFAACLIIVGILLILANFGVNVTPLLKLWPILLILIGLKIFVL